MEAVYERRHRQSSRRTGGRAGKKAELAPRERRRLIQLAVSIGLFLLVFAGRGFLPAQVEEWKGLLGQNTDFKAAFSAFGEALSQGEPVLETLEELCLEVFAGGGETVRPQDPRWAWAPAFEQRLAEQMACPGDAVGVWGRTRLEERQAAPEAEPQDQEAPGGEDAVQTGSFPLEEAPVAHMAVAVEPLVVTAQAQAFTEDGQALPESVSMAYYYLGLESVTPVSGTVTSFYGYRDHPVSGTYKFHRGVDLGAPLGSEVAAFAEGTVAYIGEDKVCGKYLQIEHDNGVTTFYAHCSQIDVTAGQRVEAGQTVARVGDTGNATGPHLHFALRKDGVYLDPLYYLEVS